MSLFLSYYPPLIRPPPPPPAVEIDTPLREIFANSNAQIAAAINGDFNSLTRIPANSQGPLRAGDHLVIRNGTYTNGFTFNVLGTQAAPFWVRAENKGQVTFTNTITLDRPSTFMRLWGIKFFGGKLNHGGTDNFALRCIFENFINVAYSPKWSFRGGAGYCEFRNPLPYTQAEIDAGRATNRFGMRCAPDTSSRQNLINSFCRKFVVWRCYFHDFPDKVVPSNYSSCQLDAIEMGDNGASIQNAYPMVINAAGDIIDFFNPQVLFDSILVKDHLQGGGTGAATIDFKVGGVTLRNSTFNNMRGRADARGHPNCTFFNLIHRNSGGLAMHGYGHKCERIQFINAPNATLFLVNGDYLYYQFPGTGQPHAFRCHLKDITGKIAMNFTGSKTYRARDITIENHTGAFVLNAGAQPSDYTRNGLPAQTTPTGELTPADVGPDADWVGYVAPL